MKNKIIFMILIIFVLVLAFSMIKGIKIGNFQILSISQIKEKNDQVNEKLEETNKLVSEEYPDNISTLEETYNEYTIQKQKYIEVAGFTKEEKAQVYETKQYDISYLWKTLGKYATSRNLAIGITVQKKQNSELNLYDLKFNLSGRYVDISQFISDIENDSELYFRIYNFKMVKNEKNNNLVTASFTVLNVNIDPSTITETSTNTINQSSTNNK